MLEEHSDQSLHCSVIVSIFYNHYGRGIYIFNYYQKSLVLFLWDIGKQNCLKCEAAKCGVSSGAIPFAFMNFIEKRNKNEKLLLNPLKMKVDSSK